MAVFPDRIVLKNSTDSQALIEAAIQTGGSDEIAQGEIVLGIANSDVKFYTKAGDGSIVSLGGTGVGAQNLTDLLDVDLSTPATDGQVIAYNSVSGNWEPVGNGLYDVVEDLTPQLGGDLDVNGNYIVSASGGDVVIAPDTTGGFVVRGNSTDGSITLNSNTNTYGVTIQSPPDSAAATYTLVLPDDVGTNGQYLSTDGAGALSWQAVDATLSRATATTASLADAGIENITITGTGKAGQLLSVETDQAAWVTVYCTQAARTSDASRLETEDPAPGSGVLLEVVTTGAQEVLVTPAVNYFNFETTPASELYAKVVNKSGATNTITVTLSIVTTQG